MPPKPLTPTVVAPGQFTFGSSHEEVSSRASAVPRTGSSLLARLENLRGPTVSPQIKSLEAAGIVVREAPNPEDRRRIGLTVTEKGRAMIETLRRNRTDWLTRRIAELSPESRRALRDAIGPLGELVQ